MENKGFQLTNTKYDEFKDWCNNKQLPPYAVSSKKVFFNLILNDKLVRSKKTNLIVEVK